MTDLSRPQPPQAWMWAASACVAALLILYLIGGRGAGETLHRVGAGVMLVSAPMMIVPFFQVRAGGMDHVVERGLYTVVRHPQYLGYMGLAWGFSLLAQRGITYALALAATAFFILQAFAEERWMAALFGDAYRDYCRRVPRFVPQIHPRKREAP